MLSSLIIKNLAVIMLSKEEVRANRAKFRAAIKVDVVEVVVEPRISAEKS